MENVALNPEILRWARKRSGLSKEVLEKKFPKLKLWEEGKKYPTLRQIESFAKKTRTPLGYFFLKEPPEERLPIPVFRTVKNKKIPQPSPDLLDTVHLMERRQAWMREYLLDQQGEPLSFAGSATGSADPLPVAREIRKALGLEEQWASRFKTWEQALRTLRASMEEAGILVVTSGVVGNNNYRKLSVKEFRGFVLHDEYAPLVFVNGSDAKAAQMFTLAHEIAHIWFGSSAAFDLRDLQAASDSTEQACNKIAAELLVPEEELRRIWPSARTSAEPFQTISRHFKVSALVGARRALDLGMIGKEKFLAFYRTYLKDDRRRRKKNEGGDFYATQSSRVGRLFANTVITAVREGQLLPYDAYKLTGLQGKTFDQFAAEVFGSRAE